MADLFKSIDKVLKGKTLGNTPKAVLLTKLCLITKLLSSKIFDKYWEQLKNLENDLPEKYGRDFKDLKKYASGGKKQKQKKGFLADMTRAIESAEELSKTDKEKAVQALQQCAEKLRKSWWVFGKTSTWVLLLKTGGHIDREAFLPYLQKINAAERKQLLIQWNLETPFTVKEWGAIREKTDILPVIEELLDESEAKLFLSKDTTRKMADKLLNDFSAEADEDKDKKNEQRILKYEKLVGFSVVRDEKLVNQLMKKLFGKVVQDETFYQDDFLQRFSWVKHIVNVWAGMAPDQADVEDYLKKMSPDHMRNFVMAEWFSHLPKNSVEVKKAYKRLLKEVDSTENAEILFCVNLVSRGLYEDALAIAEASKNSKQIVPRLQRTLICKFPKQARATFDEALFKKDHCAQFVLLPTAEKRVAFLRRVTKKGTQSLPEELWVTLNRSSLRYPDTQTFYRLFNKSTTKSDQLGEYIRLHTYSGYTAEIIDAYLLPALVQWDDSYPEEVSSFMKRLWDKVRPSEGDLCTDIVRNTVFNRCRLIFSARPDSLFDFLNWIQDTLVDDTVETSEGAPYGQVYRLSLNESVPFYYSILGAEHIVQLSQKRCDEILIRAMNDFTASDQLVGLAARFYALNKGPEAVTLPDGFNKDYQEAWQSAIVEAIFPGIARQIILSSIKTS